jgi:hypothetical protein
MFARSEKPNGMPGPPGIEPQLLPPAGMAIPPYAPPPPPEPK